MPYGKKYKRKTKKSMRRYKKYPLYSMGTPSGIPTIRRASLRYTQQVPITSSNGDFAARVFRANSIHQPEVTPVLPMPEGGRKPYASQTWATLYQKYMVVGSKISVKILLDDVGQNGAMASGVHLDTDGMFPTNQKYTTLIEARKGSWVAATNQRRANSVYAKYSTRNFFNITDVKDNIDNLGANINTNPEQVAYFVIWAQSIKPGTTNSLRAIVTIDYLVDYSDPLDLANPK